MWCVSSAALRSISAALWYSFPSSVAILGHLERHPQSNSWPYQSKPAHQILFDRDIKWSHSLLRHTRMNEERRNFSDGMMLQESILASYGASSLQPSCSRMIVNTHIKRYSTLYPYFSHPALFMIRYQIPIHRINVEVRLAHRKVFELKPETGRLVSGMKMDLVLHVRLVRKFGVLRWKCFLDIKWDGCYSKMGEERTISVSSSMDTSCAMSSVWFSAATILPKASVSSSSSSGSLSSS